MAFLFPVITDNDVASLFILDKDSVTPLMDTKQHRLVYKYAPSANLRPFILKEDLFQPFSAGRILLKKTPTLDFLIVGCSRGSTEEDLRGVVDVIQMLNIPNDLIIVTDLIESVPGAAAVAKTISEHLSCVNYANMTEFSKRKKSGTKHPEKS